MHFVFRRPIGRYDRYRPYQYSYDINILHKLNIDIFKIAFKINVDFSNNKNLSIHRHKHCWNLCEYQYCKINMWGRLQMASKASYHCFWSWVALWGQIAELWADFVWQRRSHRNRSVQPLSSSHLTKKCSKPSKLFVFVLNSSYSWGRTLFLLNICRSETYHLIAILDVTIIVFLCWSSQHQSIRETGIALYSCLKHIGNFKISQSVANSIKCPSFRTKLPSRIGMLLSMEVSAIGKHLSSWKFQLSIHLFWQVDGNDGTGRQSDKKSGDIKSFRMEIKLIRGWLWLFRDMDD